jgi:hypothetical protein
MSMALLVVASLFSWTQEQCSRILAISQRKGFNPASAQARRKVGSCMRGEQAATTTPVRFFSLMAFLIICWPGSEHMYLYSTLWATPGILAAAAATFWTSTVALMFSPQ